MGNENGVTGGHLYTMAAGSGGGDFQSPTPLESDIDLLLNSEPTYPYKKTTFISQAHHQNRHYHQASEIANLYNNPNQIASGISFKSTTGSVIMAASSGKLLFTANQWIELERQTMIFKYMMASIPIPPQLLLPLSTTTQSNRGLKFSNGSDPEPWRCKRTDGKKWRCSKDVAPDQKYCERHAHKTRPRSRKPVEIQSHNNNLPSSHVNNINNYKNPSDLFMKNGTIQMSESKRDQMVKQDFVGNFQHKSCLDHNLNYTTGTSNAASDVAAGERRQNFIDSWSRIGNGDDCSLSLSMQSGGNGMKFEDDESFGMLDGDRGGCGDGDLFRSHHHQWLNQPFWAGSTPGGPLGEALCLGITSTTNMAPNVPSSYGYSNNMTTSGSCEGSDGHGHGFIL